MAKARASCCLENLRIFETCVPALVGCLLGSVGGGVIWGLVSRTKVWLRGEKGDPHGCPSTGRNIKLYAI